MKDVQFEALHPRGADGRFIEKFGIIKFLKNAKWQYGKVSDITADSNGKVHVAVDESDLSGNTTGVTHVLDPKQIYQAPKPVSYLKTSDPKAKKIGGQAGSNPGGLYELPTSGPSEVPTGTTVVPTAPEVNQWYVKKAKSKAHGRNEDLANDLYRTLGVPVPEVAYDESDGNIYSKIVPGAVEDMTQRVNSKDEEWLDKIKRNFAIDAWLANWDVFGLTNDNIKTAPDGVPYRIDNGGALLYRAQGAAKGKDFGATVGELDSFRQGNKGKAFSGITKEQELDGAMRILALRPDEIKDMVSKHGLDESLSDTLIARRKYIADHYGLSLPEEVETKPIDTVDLTTSGGKERHWKSGPLSSLNGILSTGDMVEIDGEMHIFGVQDEMVGVAAKNIQMSQWLSKHGADKWVWFTKGKDKKPRPDHMQAMSLSSVGDYQWERGDHIDIDGVGRMEVVDVNGETGLALLIPDGQISPVLWSLRYDGDKQVTVDTWDKVVEVAPEDGVEVELEVEEDWVEQIWPTQPPIEAQSPPSTEPPKFEKAKKSAAHKTAESAIKADIDAAAQEKKANTGKVMTLGDGTEADTGAKVFSSKDNKTYLYVKKKGPYAVVTDPDSDDPNKQLLKLASTLGQPGVVPTANPAAVTSKTKPKSANGVEPQLGMTATAKDGHTGTITMVSPDGKFVFITDSTGKKKRKSIGTVSCESMVTVPMDLRFFITDSTGKKKRKSIGTVTIDSQDTATVLPEPVVSTTESQTIISAPEVLDTVDVEEVKTLYPTEASWWPKTTDYVADGSVYWAGFIHADGSYSMLPFDGKGVSDAKGFIPTSSGTIAGFDMQNGAYPIMPAVLKTAAQNDKMDFTYRVLLGTAWWQIVPDATDEDGNLIVMRIGDDGQYHYKAIDKTGGNLLVQQYPVKASSVIPALDQIEETIKIPTPADHTEFKPLTDLPLVPGDKISVDGQNWLTVEDVGHNIAASDSDGVYVYIPKQGTTAMFTPEISVVETVDITDGLDSSAFQTKLEENKAGLAPLLNAMTENPAGYDDAVLVTAAVVKEGDYITITSLDGNTFSGPVTQVSTEEVVHLFGYTPEQMGAEHGKWVYIQNGPIEVLVSVPDNWPMILHGRLEEGEQPVPLTPAQWLTTIGIKDGQYVYPSQQTGQTSPLKVLGVVNNKVQVQTTTGLVIDIHDLDEMKKVDSIYWHIGVGAPPGAVYPTIEQAKPPVKPEPDAMTMKQIATVWDSAPEGFNKPTNTTVYYDPLKGNFLWQDRDAQIVTVPAADLSKVTITPDEAGWGWVEAISAADVVFSPKPLTIHHSEFKTMKFAVPPDHSMVEWSGLMWAVPKGGMELPETWSAVQAVDKNGESKMTPGMIKPGTDMTTSTGVKVVLDVDTPLVPTPPDISQGAVKTPSDWGPAGAKVAEKYPGKRIMRVGAYGVSTFYVETAPDQWQAMVGDSLDYFKYSESDFKDADGELWDPKEAGQPLITIHGNQFDVTSLVKQKPGTQVYYIKPNAASDWKILHSHGEMQSVDSEDIDVWGEPPGDLIWPPGFEPEEPPAEVHVIGGVSTTFPKLQTEKDPLVQEMLSGASGPDVKWVKASSGGGTDTVYYEVNLNDEFVHVWQVDKATGKPYAYNSVNTYGATHDAMLTNFKKYMPPSLVYTDVTPDDYVEPTAEAPAQSWEQIVVDTINPQSMGYGGLEYVDPETLKGSPADGWDQEDWTTALDYAKTIGPNSKVIMLKGTDPEGKSLGAFYLVSGSGTVSQIGMGPDPTPNLALYINQNKADPITALLDAVGQSIDQPSAWSLADVSQHSPVNHIIGYVGGEPKTPSNQWQVPISPTWKVFKATNPSGSDAGHLYRDDDGKWWGVDPGGHTDEFAKDDAEAVDALKKFGISLTELAMPTDAPDLTEAVNVPNGNNKATKTTWYTTPNKMKITMFAGDELYVTTKGSPAHYLLKTGAGNWQYSKDVAGAGMEDWPDGLPAPDSGYGDQILEPVDLGGSKVIDSDAPTPVHPSHKSVPPGANVDPSEVLGKLPVALDSIDATTLPKGTWVAWQDHLEPDQIKWGMINGGGNPVSGTPYVDMWSYNNATGQWQWDDDAYPLSPVNVAVVYLTTDPKAGIAPTPPPVNTPAPTVPTPTGATVPGSSKPSPEDIQSWGGDLTKDGYIPASGMKVKGKGPMKGTVLSVSKDKTKAVVLTEDGKKTTRLVSALAVDHVATAQALGPVALPADAPKGHYLKVKSMDEAVQHLLDLPNAIESGQMVSVMIAGTKDGSITLRLAKGPDGKPVVRVYTRLTPEGGQSLVAELTKPSAPVNAPAPQLGAWDSVPTPAGSVKIGDGLAMRLGTSSTPAKWKPDSSGDVPTHEIIKIDAGPTSNKITVTLKSKKDGTVITSSFHTDPGKSVNVISWDPDKPVPVKPPPAGAKAVTAPGWSTENGLQVSPIINGEWQPSAGSKIASVYGGSNEATYKFHGADGSVIEATIPTGKSTYTYKGNGLRATDGFTAITIPVGDSDSVDMAKRLSASLSQLQLGSNPPDQARLKMKVAEFLRQANSFNREKVGHDLHPSEVDTVAAKGFKDFGVKVGIPDIDWHDVLVGTSENGVMEFYWSDRVVEAIEKKNKTKVLVKSNKTATADKILTQIFQGVTPGPMRVTEGGKGGGSPKDDNNTQASYGGFFSLIQNDEFPKANPFWSGQLTIYANPMGLLQKIGDTRAAANYDAYGWPHNGESTVDCLLGNKAEHNGKWIGTRDIMITGGLPPEHVAYIGVDSAGEVSKAIKALKDQGITHIGGRPVEEIIRTRADIMKLKPSQALPPVKRPANAIPILSVPVDTTALAPVEEMAA